MPDCTCIICNSTFYSKRNSQICDSCRTKRCVICGKEFKIDPSCLSKTTCSKSCKKQLAVLVRDGKSEQGRIKVCKYCGKEFISNHNRRDYCYDDHYKRCEVCGKEFKILHIDSIPKTCSRECATVATAQTNLENLGVKSNFQTEEFKEKSSRKCKALYGVNYWPQTKFVQHKISEQVSKARAEHGHEIKEKWVGTLLSNTGVASPRFTDKSKYDEYTKFINDPNSYLVGLDKPSILQLQDKLGVNNTTVLKVIHENNIEDLVSWKEWSLESDVIDFIKSVQPDIEIAQHNRTIIQPQEIDIYLPEYKLGIECNPTCTHNSTQLDPWGGSKSNTYHQNKSIKAEAQGIQLFHIFGYEWVEKRDILESMLRSKLFHTKKIYARRCLIREVSSSEAKQFLIDNHRQGHAPSKINLGLQYEGELVACMTFSKPRAVLTNDNADYELVRFCNRKNLTVVGGSSKLFKYFSAQYQPEEVISYSDIARTSGHLYETLGFQLERITEPNYTWVNTKDDSYLTRYQTQKHTLLKKYPDINPEYTEKEIMISKGYVQVFDSGNKVWRWHK